MNWTEHNNPIEGISFYDHISCETPLGKALIVAEIERLQNLS